MASADELEILVVPKEDEIAPESLMEVVSGVLSMINDMRDSHGTEIVANFPWRITETRLDRSLRMSFRPSRKAVPEMAETIIRRTGLAIRAGNNGDFGLDAARLQPGLERIEKIVRANGVLPPEITFGTLERLVPAPGLATAIKGEAARRRRSTQARTTLRGLLKRIRFPDAASMTTKPPTFQMTTVTGAQVDCKFPERLMDTLRASLAYSPIRISVTGRTIFNAYGIPKSIEVEEMEALKPLGELAYLSDAPPMNVRLNPLVIP